MIKRSNGEGSAGWVTRNGKKYWRIYISEGFDPLTGKLKRKVIYGKTQKEAKAKLKEYKENHVSNSDNSTLGSFFNSWLWDIKKQELKPSTFAKWEGIYRNYIKPNYGLNNKKIVDIDTLYLQKITNKLLEDHTVSQIKTLNGCIGNCLKYAVAINKIKYNPVDMIRYPKNHEVIEEKPNYITEEEQKELIKALEGDSLQGIVLLGLLCGMRLGESMALQTKDIDFDKRIVKIDKSVKYIWTGEYDKSNNKIYEYKVTIPKTKKSVREVPLPVMLIPILKNIIMKNKENRLKYGELYFNNDLLFCKETGFFLDSKQPNRHLKAALKKAEINTDIHYHSLRHIFITNCISKDIGLKTIMDWVGHSDTKTTMLIYAEINKEKNMKEYDKINSMFN